MSKPEVKTRIREYEKNREKDPKRKLAVKIYRLKKNYNITLDEYNELFNSQNGMCAICSDFSNTKMLAVDHNHNTGRVRGLLCQSCNVAIGLLKDSRLVITKALEYLSK